MKHHQFNQGWREVNRMQKEDIIREIAAIALCYVAAIGFMAIVVSMLAR